MYTNYHNLKSMLLAAAIVATLGGTASAQVVGSLTGTLFDRESFDPNTGQIVLAQDGFSGGYFYDPLGLNSGSAASVAANAVFSASPFPGLPNGGADILQAQIFEFEVDTFALLPLVLDPSQDYFVNFAWNEELFTGPPENAAGGPLTFSTTVTASYNDLASGFVSDGSGNSVFVALYDDTSDLVPDRGFLLATSENPMSATNALVYNLLDGNLVGGRYQTDDTNSAFIQTFANSNLGLGGFGSLAITASEIPEPATLVLAGLAVLGLVGIARRNK